jgi:hypothetical protein
MNPMTYEVLFASLDVTDPVTFRAQLRCIVALLGTRVQRSQLKCSLRTYALRTPATVNHGSVRFPHGRVALMAVLLSFAIDTHFLSSGFFAQIVHKSFLLIDIVF